MSKSARQLAAVAAVGLVLTGCVDRRLTITSDPSGALVYVSHEEVGRTPLTIPFTWYGDYDIILRRQGYATLKTHYKINPPIYEIPPLDLLSEVAPWTYRDYRAVHFRMDQLTLPDNEELIRRAEQLRERNLQKEK